MAYVWQRWLAAEFRAAGLRVIEVEDWENRGRPASTGSYDPDGALTIHHTGFGSSPSNPHPALRTLISGRPDLPGPLAPYSTGADGTVYVIAAGRCNHAGPIGKSGVLGMPLGADGNARAMGDEVDTSGTQTMPEAQRLAMATAAAVVVDHFGKTPAWVHRHQDISGSGKWDLGSLTTTQVRALTDTALNLLEDPMANYADQLAAIERNTEKLLAGQAADKTRDQRLLRVARGLRDKIATRARKDDVADIKADVDELVAALEQSLAPETSAPRS